LRDNGGGGNKKDASSDRPQEQILLSAIQNGRADKKSVKRYEECLRQPNTDED